MTVAGTATVGPTAAGCKTDMKAFKHTLLAKLCYFVLGAGLLTGWNAFLTASDYFNAVLPGRNIDRVFTVTYLPITLCLIGVVSRWPRLFWTGSSRIIASYCLFTLSCAAVPLIDVAFVQQGAADTAYPLTLLCVVLVAIGDGITQPTIYADAAVMPDAYTQCVVMGAAASGVTIGVLRLVTKGSLPQTLDGLRISTQAYFAASAAITAIALLLYQMVLPRLDVVQYCRGKLQEEQEEAAAAAAAAAAAEGSRCASPLSRDSRLSISVTSQRCQEQAVKQLSHRVSGTASPTSLASRAASPRQQADLEAGGKQQQRQQQQQQQEEHDKQGLPAAVADTLTPHEQGGIQTQQTQQRQQQQQGKQQGQQPWWRLMQPHNQQQPQQGRQQQQRQVPPGPDTSQQDKDVDTNGDGAIQVGDLSWVNITRLNWRLCVAVFMVYCVTLSIFPGFLAEDVHSSTLRDWHPVLLIFTYNIFDFLGRCIPEFDWRPRHSTLLGLALSRLALIPLYAGFGVYGAHEAAFFVLTFALGLTNGWLTTLIFCAAPRGLSSSAAESAGMINVFAELAGLNVGAYMGWLWTTGKA